MVRVFAAAGFVGLALVCGVGCNSSDGDAASGSDRLATNDDAADFCDHTLGVLARAVDSCCTAADKTTSEYGVANGFIVALAPQCAGAVQRSTAKQRVLLHPRDAEACYAAYAARLGGADKCANLTMTFSDPAGTSCRTTFTGVQDAGQLCGGDHECKDGLTCVGATATADGMCQPPPPVGAPCGSSGTVSLEFGSHPACAAGAYCKSGTCAPRIAAGEACRMIGDDKYSDCAEGLHCHLGKCSAEGPAGAGGACRSGSDCNPGYYCDVSSGAQGTCAELKAAGGTCHGGGGFTTECKGRCDAKAGATGTCVTFCGSQ
ncbi:hypothetical protein LZC95_03470 [Pendulispora brunnea]|uniref:Tryptophan synthase alpha chain n=1 Tax=Pendulispora brunnea TaxID=2905690 RepID=A0ABZ2KB31_9BACT